MQVDIGIITALPKEIDPLLQIVHDWKLLGSYRHWKTPNKLNVVCTTAIGMGQLNAAIAAQNMIAEWKPRIIILIGIAAGLNSAELGDIVIGDQIVDYELAKVTHKESKPRWVVYPTDPHLLSELVNYRDKNWFLHITNERPDKQNRFPTVQIGLVLSGNKVIADESLANDLKSTWSRALAIEMESAGIAAVVRQTQPPTPFVMIKGVCDRADSQKNDIWQNYAAYVSALYTVYFILARTPSISISNYRDYNLILLSFAIDEYFDNDEIDQICAKLGINYNKVIPIIEQTTEARIRRLVRRLDSKLLISQLIEELEYQRPKVNWRKYNL